MALLFDDDFESYAVGSGLPFGPWSGTGGTIRNFGDASNQCLGGFFDIWLFTLPQKGFTLTFSYLTPDAPQSPGILCRLSNQDPSGPSGRDIFDLLIEQDNSLTCTANGLDLKTAGGSGPPLNSNILAGVSLSPSVWYFISLIFDLETDVLTNHLVVNLTMYIDGSVIGSGSVDTGINVTTLFTGDGKINKWEFFSTTIRGSYIDNITAQDSASSDVFPHPSADLSRHANVSQAAIEWLKLPSDSSARTSQAAMEWLKLPIPDMRLSQAVIEIIYRRAKAYSFIAKLRHTAVGVRGGGGSGNSTAV